MTDPITLIDSILLTPVARWDDAAKPLRIVRGAILAGDHAAALAAARRALAGIEAYTNVTSQTANSAARGAAVRARSNARLLVRLLTVMEASAVGVAETAHESATTL